VLEPFQRAQRARDDFVGRFGVEARDERDAARVVLEPRVVEPGFPPVV
jgi:hypothetical protein